MPKTYSAEAHLFLSKGRAKFSLDYLKRLLQLGADPFRDPELEGLEGKESLIYASKCSAVFVLPAKPLPLLAPRLAQGLAKLLMACPKPTVRLGQESQLHYFARARKARRQIHLVTQRYAIFRLGLKEFFVLARLHAGASEKEVWIGIIGRKRKRIGRPTRDAVIPASSDEQSL
jgi:hypothetical protein